MLNDTLMQRVRILWHFNPSLDQQSGPQLGGLTPTCHGLAAIVQVAPHSSHGLVLRCFRKFQPPAQMSFLPSTLPSSWFPGHMASFAKNLPSLLAQTHVVLEVRDVRMPLTSINPELERELVKWRNKGKGKFGEGVKERIVVYTKRDLIGGPGKGMLEVCLLKPSRTRITGIQHTGLA